MSDQAAADDFAKRFAEYWSHPTVEGLRAILRDDVRLVAPLTPTTESLEEAARPSPGCSS